MNPLDDPSRRPPTLATFSSGGPFGDARPDQVADLMNMPMQPPGVLTMDPHLARLFEKTSPIERKFTLTWDFLEDEETTEFLVRSIKLNTFHFLCTGYRWVWTGQSLIPTFTPIRVNYGTSNDQAIGRDENDVIDGAFIAAVWGSPMEWVYLPRPKLFRALRHLEFRARLDYTLVPTPPENIPATKLELVLDGLELRPLAVMPQR